MNEEYIDISKIEVSFGDYNPPKDEQLMKLLGEAIQGTLLCRKALIPMHLIRPYSEYRPAADESYKNYFMQNYNASRPPELLVYEEGERFVMSDDYNAYYMYRAVGADYAVCTVIGETTIDADVKYGPQYVMQPPSVDVIE